MSSYLPSQEDNCVLGFFIGLHLLCGWRDFSAMARARNVFNEKFSGES